MIGSTTIIGTNAKIYLNAFETYVNPITIDKIFIPICIMHNGYFINEGGNERIVQIEIYNCLAKGNFSVEERNSVGITSTLKFEVLDSQIPDEIKEHINYL